MPRALWSGWTGGDVSVLTATPFGPGTIVDCDVLGASNLQRQRDGAGGDAGAAAGDDGFGQIEPGRLKLGAQLRGRFDQSVSVQRADRGADTARYVPGTQPGARLTRSIFPLSVFIGLLSPISSS